MRQAFSRRSFKRNRLVPALTARWEDGREMVRPGDFVSQIQANKHWVYTCVSKNSAAVASTVLRLYVSRPSSSKTLVRTRSISPETRSWLETNQGLRPWLNKGFQIEEVEEHPFLDLMQNVNPFMNKFSLMEASQGFLELTGNAYWYVYTDGLGVPVELWILPSQFVRIVGSRETFISGYLYRHGSEEVLFDADEIIHFSFTAQADSRYGRSPLLAVADAYNIMENMNTFENALFTNMARPEGYLFTDQVLSDEDFKRIQEQWQSAYGGVRKTGKTA